MLEKLFGSKTRIKLLRLFLSSEGQFYYVREITRKIKEHINSVRRELKNFKKLGLIKEIKEKRKGRKKYYQVNNTFILYPELKAVLVRSQYLLEKNLSEKIQRLGKVKLLILTGFFTGVYPSKTDLLIIGRINRKKLRYLIKKFEKEMGKEINYTVMSKEEYKYRHDLTDRFLYYILENKKIVIINKLGK